MNLAKKNRFPKFFRTIFLFFVSTFFVSVAPAADLIKSPTPLSPQKKLTPCGERPELFSERQDVLSFDGLPKSVFVGRVAHFWIESKDGSVKVLMRQNFKTGQKEFVCANLKESLNEHFAMMGPTLIDRSNEQKAGSTMWQFQLLIQGGRLGVWNHKTRLITVNEFLSKQKSASGDVSLQWIEDSHLRIHRTVRNFDLILVIEYDHVDASAI